jgi:hypothetical protein
MAGRCDAAVPALVKMENNHHVRCFLESDEKEDGDE